MRTQTSISAIIGVVTALAFLAVSSAGPLQAPETSIASNPAPVGTDNPGLLKRIRIIHPRIAERREDKNPTTTTSDVLSAVPTAELPLKIAPKTGERRSVLETSEETSRNKARAAIAEGGWELIWGELINEDDALRLIVSIPTATTGIWVNQQVDAQVRKFGQSLRDVSPQLLQGAATYLQDLLNTGTVGQQDFDGLGIKAGFATYTRTFEVSLDGLITTVSGKTKTFNNYQPYIGIRITKPLPHKQASAT